MPAYGQLVSTRYGTQLQGWNAGKGWEGWIPIQSYSFGVLRAPNLVTFAGSQSAHRESTPEIHEIHLAARMEDVDVSTLSKWAVDGEAATAKLDILPLPGGGDEGRQWLMTGAFVTRASIGGNMVQFSLNFEKFETFFLLRFR